MKKGIRVHRIIFIAIAIFISLSWSIHSPSQEKPYQGYTYRIPEETDDGWKTASLGDVGIEKSRIIRLMKKLTDRDTDHYVQGIVIIKNGKLVFEEYFPGTQITPEDFAAGNITVKKANFARDTLHFTASASKSVTSILVGIAIDKGLIQGINEDLFSYFPEYSHLNTAGKEKITIEHALSMTSGLPWHETSKYDDPSNDWAAMFFHKDPIGYVLGKSPVAPPGTKFIYSSGTTNLLGEIVRRTSGRTLSEFGEKYLFSPLGISSYEWVGFLHAKNMAVASSSLYLRPRDMAKIGQLYLQEGTWDKKRIVSAEWVKASVKESVHFSPSSNPYPYLTTGYGYQWWLGTYDSRNIDAFIAAGFGGQFIIVLPEVDTVVALTGGNWGFKNVNFQFKAIVNGYILPAIIK